jgi:hypothetical protein
VELRASIGATIPWLVELLASWYPDNGEAAASTLAKLAVHGV